MVNELPQIIVRFVDLKEWLLGIFAQSHDAMHIHVGLVLYLVTLLVLRGRGGAWLPFVLLAVLSVVAEVFDIIALMSVKSPYSLLESTRDVGNTLGWPLVLSVLLTWQRWRVRGR